MKLTPNLQKKLIGAAVLIAVIAVSYFFIHQHLAYKNHYAKHIDQLVKYTEFYFSKYKELPSPQTYKNQLHLGQSHQGHMVVKKIEGSIIIGNGMNDVNDPIELLEIKPYVDNNKINWSCKSSVKDSKLCELISP